jgi:hypothetical protein
MLAGYLLLHEKAIMSQIIGVVAIEGLVNRVKLKKK